jgi:hypothetical protein
MTDAKFEKFWTALSEVADLPAEIKPHLQTALKTAGYYDTATAVAVSASATETAGKTKKLSGYNVFMKEKMAELKTQNVPSAERMGKVAALWKALSDTQKGEWKAKAEGVSAPAADKPTQASAVATESKAPKKLSGYQLYVKEQMAVLKNNTAIAAKDRMTEIGKTWKALSDAQKAEYKSKAEKL